MILLQDEQIATLHSAFVCSMLLELYLGDKAVTEYTRVNMNAGLEGILFSE